DVVVVLLHGPHYNAGSPFGRENAADVHPVRVDPHPHPTGEIEVVRTVDAGPVDGRVTQAAHLRVYEVLPPLHAIGLLARTVEPATGCPRRDAGQRADVVHQVPPLG